MIQGKKADLICIDDVGPYGDSFIKEALNMLSGKGQSLFLGEYKDSVDRSFNWVANPPPTNQSADDAYASILREYVAQPLRFKQFSSKTPAYKESPVIGGDVCHLCGAHKKNAYESISKEYKKNGNWKDDHGSSIMYYCGTVVYKHSVNSFKKGSGPIETTVKQGEKCMK